MVKKKVTKKKVIKSNDLKPAKDMPDHIAEYLLKEEGKSDLLNSRELFKAEEKDVDLKTDLGIREIILINKLKFNNWILKDAKLTPVFEKVINPYMRLKYSQERKSRGEFVNMNKTDKTEDMIGTMSNLKNIMEPRK